MLIYDEFVLSLKKRQHDIDVPTFN